MTYQDGLLPWFVHISPTEAHCLLLSFIILHLVVRWEIATSQPKVLFEIITVHNLKKGEFVPEDREHFKCWF